MALKFVKSFKEEVRPSLKLRIHKRLAGWEEARCHKTLHASDMTKDYGFCPREFALLDVTKVKPKGQFIGTSLRTTFDMGEALHDLLRESWGLKESVGTWRCFRCGVRHPFCKRPVTCGVEGCKSKLFSYKEETFFSQSTGAVGNIDMLVDLEEPLLRMVEIKSIDKDQYKELIAPLAEHSLRTNLYMRFIEDSSHPHKHKINLKEAIVFYVCKGFGTKDDSLAKADIKDAGFSPFKEFWVKRNDDQTQDIWTKAEVLHTFRKGGGKMPQGICVNGLCKRAQSCVMVKPCWSGQYPAGV